MALGDAYATVDDMKARLDREADIDENALQAALDTASRGIEKMTGRQFNQATVATARVYRPTSYRLVDVDDFYTTTGLVIETDDGDSGTFSTTWSAGSYELYPLNGISDGEAGWPWFKVRALNSRWFPCGSRATVRVTARWGWAAVPAAVKESCLVSAVEIFKLKDTPFGVGGYGDFGIIRARDNPFVARMLAPYSRNTFLVA